MPFWFRQESHSTLLLLDRINIFPHYLTFSWAVLNLSLNCAGHTKNTLCLCRILIEHVSEGVTCTFLRNLLAACQIECFVYPLLAFFLVSSGNFKSCPKGSLQQISFCSAEEWMSCEFSQRFLQFLQFRKSQSVASLLQIFVKSPHESLQEINAIDSL